MKKTNILLSLFIIIVFIIISNNIFIKKNTNFYDNINIYSFIIYF